MRCGKSDVVINTTPQTNLNKTNNYVNICFNGYLNIMDGGFDDGF